MMEKVRTSELRGWRDSYINEDMEPYLDTLQINGRSLTEDEKEVYRWGFIRGHMECSDILSFHGRIKLKID